MDIDNLLNNDSDLNKVQISNLDIVKVLCWRLFCCQEHPFRNLYNYTKLRVDFSMLKTRQQVGQNLSDSESECGWFATLQSQLLANNNI